MSQWMLFIFLCLICFSVFFCYFVFTISLSELSDGMLKKSKYAVGFIISKPEDVLSEDQESIKKDVAALDKSIDKITDGISRFIVVIFWVVIALMAISVTVIAYDKNELIPTDVASFFNGIATPILTFFTFSGMLIAIIMQHIQMKTTLIELKLSRSEMVKSNESFRIQAENASLQKNNYLHEKFVNNFYSLFNSFNKIIDSYAAGDQVDNFFKQLSTIVELDVLANQVKHHRSLISKISAVNAQMLAYIRSQSSAGSASTESDDKRSVISETEAKQYAELIFSYVSNEVLIIFVLDAIFNKKQDYFNDLKYFGFIDHLDLKFNCVAIGKISSLMEVLNEQQINEYLRYSGRKALEWIDDFQSIFLSINNGRDFFHYRARNNFENHLNKILKSILDKKYDKNVVLLISSFDKNYIFDEFNIDLDEVIKSLLKNEYIEGYFDRVKREILERI